MGIVDSLRNAHQTEENGTVTVFVYYSIICDYYVILILDLMRFFLFNFILLFSVRISKRDELGLSELVRVSMMGFCDRFGFGS